jgi:hypothetical protein
MENEKKVDNSDMRSTESDPIPCGTGCGDHAAEGHTLCDECFRVMYCGQDGKRVIWHTPEYLASLVAPTASRAHGTEDEEAKKEARRQYARQYYQEKVKPNRRGASDVA